jgi:uncharacterized Fe-S cluster-containing radical SAM superfamily protein
MATLSERRGSILRERGIDLENRKLLVTRFSGSDQEGDLSEPPNCGGVGRLRHFRRTTRPGWPSNPLPIDPARHALGLPQQDEILAQAFQNAICDWRCWYCFVPFELLSANPRHSEWITADELVERYMEDGRRAPMIDLTGGQPDLTPEWTLWMAEALVSRGLAESVYLWVDDNLSGDYHWRYLEARDIETINSYPKYGRVGCFKGFDTRSFSFNTNAEESLFERQFQIFRRHFLSGVDCYAYVTLTTPDVDNLQSRMSSFVDSLQAISDNLPLRTVPLEIEEWGPVANRLTGERERSLILQQDAVDAWQEELTRRFSAKLRETAIHEVPIR